MVECNSGANR